MKANDGKRHCEYMAKACLPGTADGVSAGSGPDWTRQAEQEGAKQMPLNIGQREYRSAELFQPQGGEFMVRGYATTWTPYVLYRDGDRAYYEQIDRRAFDGADVSDVIFQYNHEGRVLARVSNKTLRLGVDEHGLLVVANLGTSDAAKELHNEIRSGLVTKMSWAFTVTDEEYNQQTRTRTIKRVGKVYDVSAVSIPANDGTDISARSFVDGVIQIEQERERQIQLLIRRKARENYARF